MLSSKLKVIICVCVCMCVCVHVCVRACIICLYIFMHMCYSCFCIQLTTERGRLVVVKGLIVMEHFSTPTMQDYTLLCMFQCQLQVARGSRLHIRIKTSLCGMKNFTCESSRVVMYYALFLVYSNCHSSLDKIKIRVW